MKVEITRANFITTYEWFNSALENNNVVLRYTSALEYLNYFDGYIGEKKIHLYSLEPFHLENADCIILQNYDNLDIVDDGNLCSTSINQTINDMLWDEENSDELALTEALAEYYARHNESYNGLIIEERNKPRFENQMRQWGIDCYYGG